MTTRETRIVAVFAVLGVALWYGSTAVTESVVVKLAILIGVGVVAPTLVDEWRAKSGG